MPLQIEESYTALLGERLKAGDLDVLILSLPFDEPGVMTQAVYEEPFVVLMPLGHPLEAATQVDAATLARQDLLLLGPGHCFRDQVLRFCPECNRLSVTSDNMQRTLEGSSPGNHPADGGHWRRHHGTPTPGQWLRLSQRFAQRPAVRSPGADPNGGAGLAQELSRQRVIALLAEVIRACPLGEAVRLLE